MLRFIYKLCPISTFYSTFYLLFRCLEKKLPFVPARFIGIFNVVYEVNCVLLKRKQQLKNFAQFTNFRCDIRTILRFTKEGAEIRKIGSNLTLHGYIVISDVISDVNCVSLRRKPISGKFCYIRILTLHPKQIAFYNGGGKFTINILLLAN